MKKTLIPAALVLAFASSFAVAQQATEPSQQQAAPIVREHGEHHARDPHRAAMMLSKRLNLTPDQTAKLEPIFADRQQKIAALESNSALDRKDRHKQMHAIRKDTQQQLAGILTPDQLQQMKSMHKGHHDKAEAEPQA